MQGDGEQDGGGAWQDARAQGGGEEEGGAGEDVP